MSEESKEVKNNKSDEIDLIEIFQKIWDHRKTVYKSIAIFFVIGVVIVLFSPKEYKTDVTLLVESSSTGAMSGLLQQFGGIAGINLGAAQGEEALSPDLYPDVIKSTPFLLEVLNQKVYDSKVGSTLTVYDILDKHSRSSIGGLLMGYTIGLPGKIISAISGKKAVEAYLPLSTGKGVLQLTPKQADIAYMLSKRIKAVQGESTSTLTISVEMQDPVASAQLADSVVKSLTGYIIDYRTQKAKTDLNFVASGHAEAETRYLKAQRALAAYKDQNQNVILASSKIEGDRLQAEYTLAFNLYNTLSQQLEQSKMKVQEKTPVFKVIDPARIPFSKNKPKTSLILVAMIFMGGFTGVGIVFGKMLLKQYSES